MEQVVARGNVRVPLARVQENRGSRGVDGMTVEELPQYLMELELPRFDGRCWACG